MIVSNSALWTPSQVQSSEFQGICLLKQFLDILLLETTYIISTFTLEYKHDMEKEMATHSSIIAWRIPWTEKPGRLPRPRDSSGNNTGVGCHFLLQCMKVKSQSEVTQSCLTLSNPMDCSLPGSSVHGVLQARVL